MYSVYLDKQSFDTGHIGFTNRCQQKWIVDPQTVVPFSFPIYDQCISPHCLRCDPFPSKSTEICLIELPSKSRSVYSVSYFFHSLYFLPIISLLSRSMPHSIFSTSFYKTKCRLSSIFTKMWSQLREISDEAQYITQE